jgi:hypothetical protein
VKAFTGNSPLSIANSGDFAVTSTAGTAFGIRAKTYDSGPNSFISIVNGGDVTLTSKFFLLVFRAAAVTARATGHHRQRGKSERRRQRPSRLCLGHFRRDARRRQSRQHRE